MVLTKDETNAQSIKILLGIPHFTGETWSGLTCRKIPDGELDHIALCAATRLAGSGPTGRRSLASEQAVLAVIRDHHMPLQSKNRYLPLLLLASQKHRTAMFCNAIASTQDLEASDIAPPTFKLVRRTIVYRFEVRRPVICRAA